MKVLLFCLASLTTGNGFGFQVFEPAQNALTSFLERPYRFIAPDPQNPDGDGIERRNLLFDTYFGVRVADKNAWIGKQTSEASGYVDQTNVIFSRVRIGALETESFYFAPYGLAENAVVMVLHVRNTGSQPAPVTAFSVHNFKLGAPESIEAGREHGSGGGVMVYVPIGGADVATCHPNAWSDIQSGAMPTLEAACQGDDRVQIFARDLGMLAPGETRTFGVAALFSADGDAERVRAAWQAFAVGRDAQTILKDALSEWEAWRMPQPKLAGAELATWRQSEAILRMAQVLEPFSETPKRKNHGMVLASLPPGNWHIAWVRDGAYALVALARLGHWSEAKKGLNFFLDAEAGRFASFVHDVAYRISTVRYFGNGVEDADFSGQPTRNIELDGWGLVLWAARAYVDFSGDVAWLSDITRHGDTVYEALRNGVAEALAANLDPQGMVMADASIWEVHWHQRQHFAYTTAAAARGFCDMAALARRLGKTADVARYQSLANVVKTAFLTHFLDDTQALAGSVEKLAQGANYHDGSVIEALNWNLVPEPVARATLDAFSVLETIVGGYKRVEGSTDQYDLDEWIFVDLRAAAPFLRAGETARARALLDFVTQSAAANSHLVPELYNTNPALGPVGRYSGSVPMVGYGAGAYVLALLERVGLREYADCGTEEPPPTPGGPPDYSQVADNHDNPPPPLTDSNTASACACGHGALGGGFWPLLLLFPWLKRRVFATNRA